MFLIFQWRDWYLTGNSIEGRYQFDKSVFCERDIFILRFFQQHWTLKTFFNELEYRIQIHYNIFKLVCFNIGNYLMIFFYKQFVWSKIVCTIFYFLYFPSAFSMFKGNEWCMRIYRIARPMMDKGRN